MTGEKPESPPILEHPVITLSEKKGQVYIHYCVGLWMTWDRPMAVMVALNSQATSDHVPRDSKLKSPKTISLGNSTTNQHGVELRQGTC